MTALSDIRAELERAQVQLDIAEHAWQMARSELNLALTKLGTMEPVMLADSKKSFLLPVPYTPRVEVIAPVTTLVDEPLIETDEWKAITNEIMTGKDHVFITGGAGCLSGDTIVEINRGGKGSKQTIAQLHHMLCGGISSGRKYDLSIPTNIRSLNKGDIIGQGQVVQTVYSGDKLTLTLTTEHGRSVRATADHRFLTPTGWCRLDELHVGDCVLIDAGKPEPSGRTRQETRKNYPNVTALPLHPYHAKRGMRNGKERTSVPAHRVAYEAYANHMTISDFVAHVRRGQIDDMLFVNPATHDVHHKDSNPRNNAPDNLQLMTCTEHYTYHGKAGSWKRVQARVKPSKIISVVEYGIEPTYDLTIADGMEPNFLANGIVVHNCGKTTMLEQVVKQYPGRLMVVAFTGVAALRAGGSTIHREFRFKTEALARDDISAITDPKRAMMMRNLDALLIDEASMVRADLMDAIDISLQKTRNNKLPFGGVRILAFGDLFQLPPVSTDSKEKNWLKMRYGTELPYFFHAECWREQQPKICELTTVFRQKDAQFAGALNAIRKGTMTPEHMALINSRVKPGFTAPLNELWLELTTTNDSAARANEKMLSALLGEAKLFSASVMGDFKEKDMPTEQFLRLKVGAVVMFVKNDNQYHHWVNGTMGKVTNLDPLWIKTATGGEHQVEPEAWTAIGYEYDEAKKKLTSYERGKFIQVPVKPAAAITVHKSQGSSFDRCIINMPSTFASGQGYVALSRCRTLQGMVLRHRLKDADVKVDEEVIKFMSGKPIAHPIGQMTLDEAITKETT